MATRGKKRPARNVQQMSASRQDGRPLDKSITAPVEADLAETDADVAAAQADIDAHEARTDNPHATTAAQVGAPPTTRTITAGAGLTGGGDLSADRTLDVGAGTGITVGANSVAADFGTGAGKVTEGNDARLSDTRTPTDNTVSTAKLVDDAVINAKLANMAADTVKGRAHGAGAGAPTDLTPDQQSAILDTATDPFIRTSAGGGGGVPTTRLITAGAGLTGGGDLSADRTLDVGAGTGITVNANDVALDTAHARNVDHSAVSVIAGAGLTGGGTIEADRTLNVGAGTGIVVNANDVAADFGSGAGKVTQGNDARLSDARAPTAHNILDSTYHGDVLTGTVVRGDILYGNSTPKIARKAVGTGVLAADGTDVTGWTQSPTLASPVVTTLLDLQGGQIKFPATQIPSSDANTLDDYEEGDWTPVDSSGAGLTLKNPDDHTNGAKGRYVKIGRMVYQAHKIEYPVTADGSTAKIGGFPFTTENETVPMYWGGYHTYTNSNGVTWNLNANKSLADAFYNYAPGLAAQTNAQMSAKVIYGNIQYRCTG
jgi:hypothetical protein